MKAGKNAARTKQKRYGGEGLSEIARKAYRTRTERKLQRLTALERHIVRVAAGAKNRARRAGLVWHEDLEGWAIAMMKAQNFRCAFSGVEFDLTVHGHGPAPRPFAPSIDRINSKRGYTEDNIRIVCWAVNCLFGTWVMAPPFRLSKAPRSSRKHHLDRLHQFSR